MPTTIVSGRSNPEDGEINQHDLYRIFHDFGNFVDIKSTISRDFIKVNTVSIPYIILSRLLKKSNTGATWGIFNWYQVWNNAPESKAMYCRQIRCLYHLTVVAMINSTGNELLDQVDDYIITPGFKECSDGGIVDRACCPVITPRRP